MNSIIVNSIVATSLFAGLAIAEPVRYTVIDLGTLGGTYSFAYGINNAGWVSGGLRPRPRYTGPRHTGRTKQRGGRT